MRRFILTFVDPFYPLFRRIFDLQTYRYGVIGSFNTGLDIFLYFFFYHFILKKEMLNLGFITISPYIAAFLMSFCITFPVSFILLRIIVFPDSYMRKRVQIFRYFSVVVLNMFLNYVLLKFFVELLGIYPTPSKIIITAFIIVITYLLQRNFTFKEKKTVEERIDV